MLADPDFEPEFYENQILMIRKRYAQIFKSWNINWDAYFENISHRLRNNQYWIWVYLCGLEKFIQEDGYKSTNRKEKLEKDADARIGRIIGDSFKVIEYVKSLSIPIRGRLGLDD